MARYVLPVVGAGIGFAIGGPAGAQLGWALGAAAGSIVDPQVIKGPGVGDIAQQTSQAGVPRPIVFGTSKPIAGNIIASAEPRIVKKKQGGKGGPKVETESVYRTYAIRICEGPVDGILRVWRNNVLVYDAEDPEFVDQPAERNIFGVLITSPSRNENFLERARFFLGDFDQLPSPDLEAVYGVGTTPAYRGTCYMVMADEDVTGIGGAIPQWMFQVASGVRIPVVSNSVLWPWLTGSAVSDPRHPLNEYEYTFAANDPIGSVNEGATGGDDRCSGIGASIYGLGAFTSLEAAVAALNAAWEAAHPGNREYTDVPYAYSHSASVLSGDNFQYPPNSEGAGPAVTQYQRYAWLHLPIVGLAPAYNQGTKLVASYNLKPSGSLIFSVTESGAGEDTYPRSLVSQKGNSTPTDVWNIGLRQIVSPSYVVRCTSPVHRAYSCAVARAKRLPGRPDATAELISGTFKVLQQFQDSGGTGDPTKHPLNPCLEAGHASYDSQAFWEAAYAEEVAAGRMAGGLTYGVHYPVEQDWAYAYYTIVDADTIPVTDIIDRICERVGLPYYDHTDLVEDQCWGLTVTNEYPAYTALTALGQVFMFDGANIDAELKFVKRGKNTVGSFDEDDLVDDQDIDFEQSMRQDSIAVPRVMHLNYFDIDGGLATSKQSSERPGDWRSTGEASMSSAVVMDSDQAATVVAIQHKVAIEELRGEQELTLPDKFIGWTPTDTVFGTVQGVTARLRVVSAELLDGMQKYKMVYDRQSIYTSDVEGIPAVPPTAPPSGVVGPTVLVPLDIHILQDADDAVGLIGYLAVSGVMEAWQGAKVEISYDGGANYSDLAEVTQGAVVGQLSTPLPDHPHQYPDVTNSVVVELLTPDAALEETTLAGMQNGLNRAAIGTEPTEIIQFAEAAEGSQTFWELANLLRGRKGSPARLHAAGEPFVLLDRSSLVPVPANLTDIGRTLTFRATSYGTSAESATVLAVDFVGNSQIERAPNCLHAYRLADELQVSWKGVGRLGAGAQSAHGSRFDGYRVRFTDGVDTIQVDTFEESLVQDVSTLASPCTVSVRQLNTLTGEGPAIEVIA